MMYELEFTHQYLRDLQLARKRNLDESKLNELIIILMSYNEVPAKYNDHPLRGYYKGYRDCHINNDWILIYKKDKTLEIIRLIRTGTHSDIFG